MPDPPEKVVKRQPTALKTERERSLGLSADKERNFWSYTPRSRRVPHNAAAATHPHGQTCDVRRNSAPPLQNEREQTYSRYNNASAAGKQLSDGTALIYDTQPHTPRKARYCP
ncbi:hypothetical protein Defa_23320 [Desulfovibrio sp. TH_2024_36128]|uniref:Uncharacterized protein n=1 Tax=Desulfovibrio falkowii TaxID=3136602 RepID=A0ABQ0EAK7_9BACT